MTSDQATVGSRSHRSECHLHSSVSICFSLSSALRSVAFGCINARPSSSCLIPTWGIIMACRTTYCPKLFPFNRESCCQRAAIFGSLSRGCTTRRYRRRCPHLPSWPPSSSSSCSSSRRWTWTEVAQGSSGSLRPRSSCPT